MDLSTRCPTCRGAKKMPKIGGMVGDCNTCKGTGRKPETIVEEASRHKAIRAELSKKDFTGEKSKKKPVKIVSHQVTPKAVSE